MSQTSQDDAVTFGENETAQFRDTHQRTARHGGNLGLTEPGGLSRRPVISRADTSAGYKLSPTRAHRNVFMIATYSGWPDGLIADQQRPRH